MAKNQVKIVTTGLIALAFIFIATKIFAATTGTIDPNNSGDHFAAFVHAPNNQAGSAEINFGKFTTDTADDITISAGSLSGYAWSPIAGWIVMNCANTTSGCSSSNQNFKVVVDNTGVLSGYAWGQQTGWINFGPFANSSTSQVKINTNGQFGGTSGSAGYAWSEKYGWIVFDCSNANSCTSTNYTVGSQTVSSSGTSSGNGASGGGPAIPPSAPQQTAPSAPSGPSAPEISGGSGTPTTGNVSGGSIGSSPVLSSEPTVPPSGISPQQPPVTTVIPAIPSTSQSAGFNINYYLTFFSNPMFWLILLLIVIILIVIINYFF